jgi:hypothetical protein
MKNEYEKEIEKIILQLEIAVKKLKVANKIIYCARFKELIEESESNIELAYNNILYMQDKKPL